jgi:uncharacterized damage-inducible protein DinB
MPAGVLRSSEGAVREIDRVADLLMQTYAGDPTGAAWFGPALRPLLGGLSPAAAARRPLPRRHTIWELVLHVTANLDFVLARLDGRELELSPEADWPPTPEPTAAAWSEALAALDARYEALLARVRALGDEQLADPVVGRPYPVYAMLHGIIQHNVYHAGQVALLREAAPASGAA